MTRRSMIAVALSGAARAVVAALLLALISGGLFVWKSSHERATATATPTTSMPVTTAIAEKSGEPNYLDAVGSLEAVRQVVLAPEVPGRVVGIFFSAGVSVRAGDPLVQLFDTPETSTLAEQQAKIAFSRVQLDRARTLVPVGAQTKERLDQQQSDLDALTAQMARTRAIISQKSIRAAFAGEIGLRKVNMGQYLNAGDPIATLTDLSQLYVDFNLPQKTLGDLRTGRVVEVRTDAYRDRVFRGRVNAIEPQVGADTRNVALQAELDNADHALRPGMYVQVRLMLPAQPDIVTVPATAIVSSSHGDQVFAVDKTARESGKVQSKPVQVGRQIGTRVEIAAGLSAGEVVVTRGQDRIAPGATVSLATAAADEKP